MTDWNYGLEIFLIVRLDVMLKICSVAMIFSPANFCSAALKRRDQGIPLLPAMLKVVSPSRTSTRHSKSYTQALPTFIAKP